MIMTDEQIKQNAEAYADVFGRHMVDYYGVKDAFIAGANSFRIWMYNEQNRAINLQKNLHISKKSSNFAPC